MISITTVQLDTIDQYLRQLAPPEEPNARQQEAQSADTAEFWTHELTIQLDPAFVSGRESIVIRSLPSLILHAHTKRLNFDNEMAFSVLLALSELLNRADEPRIEGWQLKSFLKALALFVESVPERAQVVSAICQNVINIAGPNVFTFAHSLFAGLCLQLEQLELGWTIAQHYITSVVPGSFEPKDLPQYFINAGVIASALKHYDRAIDLLDDCISLPAKSPSRTMIDAAKKRILLCLIHYGRIIPYREGTEPSVIKSCMRSMEKFLEFADAFPNVNKMESLLTKHAAVFEQGGNVDLVRQCIIAAKEKKLLNLTNVYKVIEKEKLASQAELGGIDELIVLLNNLRDSGKLNFTVDGGNRYITLQKINARPPVNPIAILSELMNVRLIDTNGNQMQITTD